MKLISIIALAGELPASELINLGGNLRHIRRKTKELVDNRKIKLCRMGGIHSYRLSSKTKRELLKSNPLRYEFFIGKNVGTNNLSNEITKRKRLHSIAETTLMMVNAGVKIYRDKKPLIFEKVGADSAGIKIIDSPTFYNSREIKAIPGEATKIKNSRSVGLLVNAKNISLLYHMGENLIKWYPRSETKLSVICNYLFSVKGEYPLNSINAIMIGKTMENALSLLESAGGYRRQFFMVDNIFEVFHFITNDINGQLILKLILNPKLNLELNHILFDDYLPINPDYNVVNDAISDDGVPVIQAYDFDLVKIKRFRQGLILKDMAGIIYCFDFQKETLSNYFQSIKVKIHTIDTEKFKKEFGEKL